MANPNYKNPKKEVAKDIIGYTLGVAAIILYIAIVPMQ